MLSDQDRQEVDRIAREVARVRVADDFPKTRQELLDFLREFGGSGAVPAAAFVGLPFAAGWGNYGSGFRDAGYFKDEFGFVHLRGLVTKTGGTPAAGNVIATLPAACAPGETEPFLVLSGEIEIWGRVDVDSSGGVVWRAGGTSETDFTALSGLTFFAG